MFNVYSEIKQRAEKYFACRAYQAKLPAHLKALYGPAKLYSPTQITIAIRRAGLSVEHRQYAYEMYLSQEQIAEYQRKSHQHRDNSPLPTVKLNKTIFS